MAHNQTEFRKLAAIMFTDMVGYSALTQQNEERALRLLEEHKQLLRPLFARFFGNEIKTIGDAFLVEFSSALDAARCAIEIQQTLHEHNASAHVDSRIQVRIGLHVGDVVFKENDVYGDGVNIAARIEPLAAPGGICLSEDVARQVQNKIDLPLQKLGRGDLKNIELPVGLYKIVLPWEPRGTLSDRLRFLLVEKRIGVAFSLLLLFTALYLWQAWRQENVESSSRNRVAVLPLTNIGSDAQDEYFADGMTEELISSLSKIGGLNVIARTSIMKYKGARFDIPDVGHQLKVGTILGGSVRKAADRMRVTVRLIDVATQEVLWSDDYDREIKDVFGIQSDIAMRVATALKIHLLDAEQEQIARKGTENVAAYGSYLLGRFHFNKRTEEDLQKAIEHFDRAVADDPRFALAYAGLAECYTLIGGAGYGSLPREVAVERATTYATEALELDEKLAEAYTSLAYVQFRLQWDWENAEKMFKRAIELKPSYARAHEWYALYLGLLGRTKEALVEMSRAHELDPLSASVNTGLGRILAFDGQYEKSVEQLRKTIALDSTYAEAHFGLSLTLMYLHRYDEAIHEGQKAVDLSGRRLVTVANLGSLYAASGRKEKTLEILAELTTLSKKTHVSPYYFAMLHFNLGYIDKAFDFLYKAYEEHEGLMVYLKADDMLKDIKGDPRMKDILRKVGLEK